MKQGFLNFSKLLFLSLILTACGGGGSTDTALTQGVFVDAPVQGLRFETLTQSGLTDANGTFSYLGGETVEFYIGDVLLGSSRGAARVTPIDLVPNAVDEKNPQVTNILRFLQSLDDGANLNDGIQISAATRTAFASQTMDFSLAESAFESAFNLMSSTALGGINLVATADAQAHMRNTLLVIDLPSGKGGFGRITITGDSAVVALIGSSFEPTNIVSGSFWAEEGFNFQLDIRAFKEQVGAVTLVNFGTKAPQFSINCGTIVAGNSCSGVNINLTTLSVTFTNLSLNSSDGSVIILNGTLFMQPR